MRIVQITPGAGGMYCGNCLRDNALVRQLRGLGHETLMVPLYLPITLDEADESKGTPTFFGGISVYLEQHSALFRRAPGWFHKMLRSPALLKWAAGRTAKTRPEEVADLTVSMLRGEEGNQVRELNELVDWLSSQGRPDAVCLSNVLLIGMARRLQAALKAPVFCTLQGEDAFLDALPATNRDRCYDLITERARDLAGFVAQSHYFGDLMSRRLALEPSRVQPALSPQAITSVISCRAGWRSSLRGSTWYPTGSTWTDIPAAQIRILTVRRRSAHLPACARKRAWTS